MSRSSRPAAYGLPRPVPEGQAGLSHAHEAEHAGEPRGRLDIVAARVGGRARRERSARTAPRPAPSAGVKVAATQRYRKDRHQRVVPGESRSIASVPSGMTSLNLSRHVCAATFRLRRAPRSSPSAPQASPRSRRRERRGRSLASIRLLPGAQEMGRRAERLAAALEVLGEDQAVGLAAGLELLAGEPVARGALLLRGARA